MWLRITEIAQLTNLSRRYWQRRFARGDVPGARQVQFGRRRLFLVNRRQFETWWTQRILVIPASQDLNEKKMAEVDAAPGVQTSATTTASTRSSFADVSTIRATQRRRPTGTSLSMQRSDPRQRAFAFDKERPDQCSGVQSSRDDT
jgi:hypothetical protein